MSALPTSGAVLCGVDDSECSRRAVRVAVALADAVRAPLVLAHVLGAGPSAPSAATAAEGEGADVAAEAAGYALLDEIAAQAGAAAATRRVVRFGHPAGRLTAVAERERAAMIVVGTGGQMALRDALLGSVSGQLAADAPCPVVVVPPRAAQVRAGEALRVGDLVCGYDGSPSAWGAALTAAGVAAQLSGRLRLVAVGAGAATLATAELGHALHGAGRAAVDGRSRGAHRLDVRVEARRGDPAEQLEATAAAATAPLIVVGSRGLGPWRAAVLGSVSRRVLRIARRPVMIVPATMTFGEAAA